jgi:isoquinoline 1-oxidoreductase beta subunit
MEFGKYKIRVAHQMLRGWHLLPYGAPNLRVEINTMTTLVPTGAWRSTGSYANVFYLESFVEEMARAAGQDPIEYRRRLVRAAAPQSFEDNAQADWLIALDALASHSGWGKPLPKGTGMGFAIDDRKSVEARGIALCALAATVSVTPQGVVTIERLDVVHDKGHALINPEAAERQIRGMTAWGLGPLFGQAITIRGGAVEQSNFDDYPVIRMDTFPKTISINYIRTNRWISGIGEEVVPLIAPAVCNAIHAATGKRVRSLPLVNPDLIWDNTI